MHKVIIDTDIGNDIDDTWALGLLLTCNIFDIKLISVSEGDVDYKVKLVAKILQDLERTDIPIARGNGVIQSYDQNSQELYLNNFSLDLYKGKIYDNYTEAYMDVLSENPGITVLALSPYTSLFDVISLLEIHKAKIVAMAGSVRKGYFGSDVISPECNIVSNVPAARSIINAKITYTMLPLDVCGKIILAGEDYQMVKQSKGPIARMVMKNYQIWNEVYEGGAKKFPFEESSSILYDLVPIWYSLFPQNFVTEELSISIDNEGYTREGAGRMITVATEIHNVSEMLHFTAVQLAKEEQDAFDYFHSGSRNSYSLFYSERRDNPELSVYECGWENCRSNHSYGPTKRQYYILHYIVKGEGSYTINGKTYQLGPYDCFLIPPEMITFYKANPDNPWSYYWVGFNGLEAKKLLMKAGFFKNNEYALHMSKPEKVEKYIKEIATNNIQSESAEYSRLGNLYLLFAVMINETKIENERKSNEDHISKAIKYMNTNYMNNIGVQEVAAYVGLERSYFYRLFKSKMAISPQDYLINIRLSHSLLLLKDTNLDLQEIAYRVGYRNYLNFYRIFVKKYKISPKAYRESPWATD